MAEGWEPNYNRDGGSRRGSDEDDLDFISPNKEPQSRDSCESSQLFPTNSLSNFFSEDEALPPYNGDRSRAAAAAAAAISAATASRAWDAPTETHDANRYREPQRGLPSGSDHFVPEGPDNALAKSKVLDSLFKEYKLQAQFNMGGAISKSTIGRASVQLALLKGANRETLDNPLEFSGSRGGRYTDARSHRGVRDFFPETFTEANQSESTQDTSSVSRRTSISVGESETPWNSWEEPGVAAGPLHHHDLNNYTAESIAIGCNPPSLYGNGIGLSNPNIVANGYASSSTIPSPGAINLLGEELTRKLNVISPRLTGPADPIGAMSLSTTNNGFHGENGLTPNPNPLILTPQYSPAGSYAGIPGCVTPGNVTPNINMRGGDLSVNYRLPSINAPPTPQFKGPGFPSSHTLNLTRGPVKQLDFGADDGSIYLPLSSAMSTSPLGDQASSNLSLVSIPGSREHSYSESMYMPPRGDPCIGCRQMTEESCSTCVKRCCHQCVFHHQCLGPPFNFSRMPMALNSHVDRPSSNYPVQNSPNHLALAVQPRAVSIMEAFAPPLAMNGRNAGPLLKYCDSHLQYFVRFTTVNNAESVCTVCLMKRIGGKFAKRFSKVIPIPNFDNTRYQELVNELFVIVEKLPILIGRYFRDGVDPFEMDPKYGHPIFKMYDGPNTDPLLTNLNRLIEHVNIKIRFISNFTNSVLQDYTANTLATIREEYERLWKHVEGNGPSKIALAASTEDCGKGQFSFLTGPAMSGKIVKEQETVCYVVIRNRYDKPRESNRDALKFDIRSDPDGIPVRFTMNSVTLKGVYEVFFTLVHEGNYKITATVNNEMIQGSPHLTKVTSEQTNYNRFYEPKVLIGDGFLEDNVADADSGFFNRPWGVHITEDGFILLADRSNHKVHVLDKQYSYSHNIGGDGNSDGRFKRPSKAIDIKNPDGSTDILVSDKDNNRLQILTWNGVFKRKTSETEDLKYPWDVCLTPEGVILCTDSRKQRISCFSLNFQLIKVVSLPPGVSPRGICMGYLNHCIVTEFCNHDILILFAPSQKYLPNDSNATCYRRYSMKTTQKMPHNSYQGHYDKRCGEKNQDRLQGVTMDQYGNILVCDSRQKKVRVVSYLGRSVAEWEIEGEPQGLAAVPDKVAVVNAGKNRLDLFF